MKTSDVVLSCRVRLARNLAGSRFVNRQSPEDAARVIDSVASAPDLASYRIYRIDKLPPNDRQLLVERHLASPELIVSPNTALLTNADNSIAIMVNEEDHLRIQSFIPSLDLPAAYDLCAKVDRQLSEKLSYAFDSRLGYLTACPTNLGTGMRASAMLHLVGLGLSGQLEPLLQQVVKLGMAVRGFYGEGSSAPGYIYQISNQHTLGQSEQEIISMLSDFLIKIAEQEMNTRSLLLQGNETEIKDRIGRSLGICLYAEKLGFQEFMQHISNIKLGISLGILDRITMRLADDLLLTCQCASLSVSGGISDEISENIARAQHIKKILKEM